jgi:hypothetical protein
LRPKKPDAISTRIAMCAYGSRSAHFETSSAVDFAQPMLLKPWIAETLEPEAMCRRHERSRRPAGSRRPGERAFHRPSVIGIASRPE